MRQSGRLVTALIAVLLAACTPLDPLDQRGETVNRSAANYANNATLLNIIRAMRQEPLTFITITGLGGTDSVGGSLGLPTIALGPTAVSSPRNYAFGSNSLTRSNSSTFQFSVIDDPASFAGLMAPVNPAAIAYLIRQGFPTPLLFFLLTSEIRETSSRTGGTRRYVNDPMDPSYGDFIGKMASLLHEGLVAQVDATAFPSGKVLPASRLCIDPPAAVSWTRFGLGLRPAHYFESPPASNPALCDNVKWTESDVAVAAPGGSGGGVTSLGVAQDGSIWTMLSPTQLLRIAPDGTKIPVEIDKKLLPPAAAKVPSHIATFSFNDTTGKLYQIYLRSTLGAYSYIGTYYPHQIENLLPPDDAGSGSMIDIVPDQTQNMDCFARAEFRGKHYCIPQDAGNTKKLVTVLHLLQQLQTAPSNVPTTLTVTPVP